MNASKEKTKKSSIAGPIVALLCIAAMASVLVRPPGQASMGRKAVKGPITHAFGFLYQTDLPLPLDLNRPSDPSPKFRLFEGARELGPGNANIQGIVQQGRGGYAYQNGKLQFSSSDGSNPATNGRTYTVQGRFKILSPSLYLFLLFLIYIFALFALHRLFPATLKARKWLLPVLNLLVLAMVMETCFWAMTRTQLANGDAKLYNFYDVCFGDGNLVTTAGGAMNFAPHDVLPYAINGKASYFGEAQYNGEYKIRRKEPIRPRDQVAWRALCLGGSTTFDEAISREEFTWPYQLESLVRKKYGPNLDVINGGVMGYTLLDNIAHYENHLKALSPDLVILFVGINDIHPRFYGTIQEDYGNYRQGWRDLSTVFPKANPALSGSWIYRFLMLRTRLAKMKSMHIGQLVNQPQPDPATWGEALKRNGPQIFEGHLSKFVAMLKAEGKQVVLLPQIVIDRNSQNPKARMMDALYVQANQEHNAASARVAATHQVPYDQDLEPLFSRADLSDNSHFNYKGSEKMAKSVFAFLEAKGLIPK